MATCLKDLETNCDETVIPGTEVDIYAICRSEITTFPAYLATTNPGDSVRLDGDFVLEVGAVWKKITVIVDTGKVDSTQVGVQGSKSHQNMFDAIVPGVGPATAEFQECIAKGCNVWIVPDKNGNNRVLGTKKVPATCESAVLTTGAAQEDQAGLTIQIKDTSGRVAPYYSGTIPTA